MTIYEKLLKEKRRRESSVENRELWLESESDKGRVLFCAPFRRLQQKAQVFSLEKNAAVRSRLTHSLEVAYLGRLMAIRVLNLWQKNNRWDALGLSDLNHRIAFANFVETACLAHDIGNPPFGHLGEAAVRKWFQHNAERLRAKSLGEEISNESQTLFKQKHAPDLCQFDGNAQGFRILTRLQFDIDKYSLNLTYSQLASFLKYTRATSEEPSIELQFNKKPGYFETEVEIVKKIREIFSISEGKRFPLVYLVEAADDIAYCLGDVEDGLEKNLFSEDLFWSKISDSSEFEGNINNADLISGFTWGAEKGPTTASRFKSFKVWITRKLAEQAAEDFVTHHDSILEGNAAPLLDLTPGNKETLKKLKSFSRKNLYNTQDAIYPELTGFRVLSGLLDHLAPLLDLSNDKFQTVLVDKKLPETDLERRLFYLLPTKYIMAYKSAVEDCNEDDKDAWEWFYRAHLIVDYLSGMTDGFALETYQLLEGIKS